jgi:3-oxoacyl-[acyl-carrier-protein] synthase-3
MVLNEKSLLSEAVAETPYHNIPVIPISGQPCSIYHFGVQTALRSIRRNKSKSKEIIIGFDIAVSNRSRFYFGSAMGDCVTIGLIGTDKIKYEIINSLSISNIIASNGENSPKNDITRFRLTNPSLIRTTIDKCLESASLKLSDINWIIPHSPYKKIIDIIVSIVDFPKEKIILDYISITGHLNSNDSFCSFSRSCNGKILHNDIALLINPGFGGTCGVTILRKIRRVDV